MFTNIWSNSYSFSQPHFTDTSISVAFYLNGTAYFEYLNEEKIRQRLQLLNNPRKTSFHRGELAPVLTRLKSMLAIETLKQDNSNNELPQFDSQLFLSTPMTLVDDCEEEDIDDDTVSSSTTGRLWKASFGRRGGQHFLDICLLKKAYMKALEDMDDNGDDDEEIEAVSSTLNNMVEQVVANDDNDEIGLASRMAKRSITSSINTENDAHQMKRLRSNPTAPTAPIVPVS